MDIDDDYPAALRRTHAEDAQRLMDDVDRHGWPTISRVGRDASEAAWLVVQHAIGHPAIQRKALQLMRQALAQGEVEARHVAMLEDRIAFLERRPQRYGTQFDWTDDGVLEPWDIIDPANVDVERARVGLSPLAERWEEMRQRSGPPPTDPVARRQRMEAWLHGVGWIAQIHPIDGSALRYGDVRLRLAHIVEGDPSIPAVPYYHLRIELSDGTDVGRVNLRVGLTDQIRYVAGHVGFAIDPAHRGHGYAFQACMAVRPLIQQWMPEVLITCDPDNTASRRTIERLGATYFDTRPIPEHEPAYQRGERWKRRYGWGVR